MPHPIILEQPHLPFFFLLSSLSSQLLSKQSRLGFLSWTRQRCPLRWLLHVKLLKMWHTGRIWNKPIVAETKGEIVTVGGIGVDMGHCQWLTDGLKVGPKVGARSEVWADYSCKTIHRFHNWFSQSRRRPLLGPSPGWKLLRHYAKRALTPRSLNVKLGPRRNYHKGRAVWIA